MYGVALPELKMFEASYHYIAKIDLTNVASTHFFIFYLFVWNFIFNQVKIFGLFGSILQVQVLIYH